MKIIYRSLANRKFFLLLTAIVIALFVGALVSGQADSNAQQPQIVETQTHVGHLVRITPQLADIDKNSMYGQPLVKTRDEYGVIGIGHNIEETEENIEANLAKANPNKVTEGIQKPETIFPNVPGTSIGTSFDGQTSPGLSPTDNNMAAGPNHIIQIVNNASGSQFTIWNKAGVVVQGPTVLASITGLTGFGDPCVVYDQLADRWVMTEFGPNTLPINSINVAVSVTANPTGAWKIYQYTDLSFFIDYPKLSVWHNGYYLNSNDFNNAGNSYLGSSVYSMDRAAMIAGAPTATMIRTRLNNVHSNYYNMGTIGLEGLTASSQNGLFAYPIGPTGLHIFEVTPNFVAGTQTVGTETAITIPAYATPPSSVTQQGGGTAQSLGERFLFKLNYRNNSGTESVVITHTVGNGTLAAVRWYELRRVASIWGLFQSGTIAGSDGNSRWMGSISMDGCGNIALMYDKSGATANPSIMYTGRNASDPFGTMPLAEQTIVNGASAHTSNSRWGDYNSTVQDYMGPGVPNNGSFWSTSQYGNQLTHIANWTLTGGCVAAPTQVVSRKQHGAAGAFDIVLPLTGTAGVECRSGGATNDYQVVFTFPSSVTFTSAAVTAGAGSVSSSGGSGTNTVTVNLTGITNAQRITVTLSSVNNGTSTGDVSVPMGVLLGDTNGNGSVSATDVSQVKAAASTGTVNGTNFRTDVNASGTATSTDVAIVKANSGQMLPP